MGNVMNPMINQNIPSNIPNNQFLNRKHNLPNEYNQYEEQNKILNRQINNLNEEMKKIKNENIELEKKIEVLEKENNNLMIVNKELLEKTEDLENDYIIREDNYYKNLKELNDKIIKLSQDNKSLQEQLNEVLKNLPIIYDCYSQDIIEINKELNKPLSAKDKKFDNFNNYPLDHKLLIENKNSKHQLKIEQSIKININASLKEGKITFEGKYIKNFFKKEVLLGKGGYGIVKSVGLEFEIAIKELDKSSLILRDRELGNPLNSYKKEIENEVNNMYKLKDEENAVKLYGFYETKDKYIILMEKCEQDLKKFLDERKILTLKEIKDMFLGLNKTFKHMRHLKMFHRDIKLENLLVKKINDSKYIVKLADFGLSKIKETGQYTNTENRGTPYTLAPEIELVHKYDDRCDLFSIGVVLFILYYRYLPFGDKYFIIHNNYQNHYDKDNYNLFLDSEDNNFNDLVKKLLRINPSNRITWDAYFNHPFFNE